MEIIEEPTEDYAKKRYAICKNCEHFSIGFCNICKCFMPVKTLLKYSSCPLKKWERIQ